MPVSEESVAGAAKLPAYVSSVCQHNFREGPNDPAEASTARRGETGAKMAAAAAFQWSLAALETLMAEDQMDRHAAVLRAFSVVELWRLRRVCRAFHRWGTAAPAPAMSGMHDVCEK